MSLLDISASFEYLCYGSINIFFSAVIDFKHLTSKVFPHAGRGNDNQLTIRAILRLFCPLLFPFLIFYKNIGPMSLV